MILEELIVELALDPAKFTKGQKDALDSFKKTDEEMQKKLKGLEDRNKQAGYSFDSLTKGAEGLFTVIAGAGLVTLVRNTMIATAETGRMATNIGAATQELSGFGRMIERNGGSADAAMASMKGFTDQVTRLNTFSEGSPELFKFLGMIGAPQGANALETYLKFAEWAEQNKDNPQLVNIIGQSGGLDQGSINEALKGRAQVMKDLAAATKGAIQPGQAESAVKMQASWASLGQTISTVMNGINTDVEPTFSKIADSISKWVDGNQKLATTLGEVLAGLIGLSALKPAAWLLRLLGLGGAATVASTIGTAAAAAGLAYEMLPSALNEGEKDIYKDGKLTEYGRSLSLGPAKQAPGAAAGGQGFKSLADKEAFIRAEASKVGINPEVALRVAKSEGFYNFKSTIPGEKSYGAFQLHVTPGGRGNAVGDQFQKQTGLDPSDPANEAATITFALNWARQHGWRDFHGAANSGIGNAAGIGEVNIGTLVVQTQATDTKGIAAEIHGAIRKQFNESQSIVTPANTGLN